MKSTTLPVSSTDKPGAAPVSLDAAQTRKIVIAAYIGTALEWYDFFLFGTVAAIVFAPLFFPGQRPGDLYHGRVFKFRSWFCCPASGGGDIRAYR